MKLKILYTITSLHYEFKYKLSMGKNFIYMFFNANVFDKVNYIKRLREPHVLLVLRVI